MVFHCIASICNTNSILSVTDEIHTRNASCVLNLISTFLLWLKGIFTVFLRIHERSDFARYRCTFCEIVMALCFLSFIFFESIKSPLKENNPPPISYIDCIPCNSVLVNVSVSYLMIIQFCYATYHLTGNIHTPANLYKSYAGLQKGKKKTHFLEKPIESFPGNKCSHCILPFRGTWVHTRF